MNINRSELLEKIRKAGVVGAGGAGYPTYQKLNYQVETVIVNGAECELLSQSDKAVMSVYPDKIIHGLKTAMKLTNAGSGIIAIKKKYQNVLRLLKKSSNNEITFKLLDDFYPVGDEKILIYHVLGKILPEGELPVQLNTLVLNAETILNISNAVNDIPVTEKFLTVSGEIEKSMVFRCPIGFPVFQLLQHVKILINNYCVILNGPMMGQIIDPENSFIDKRTNSIIILPAEHILIRKLQENISKSFKLSKSLCIQCNTCTDNCPRHALGYKIKPHLIMKKVSALKMQILDEFVHSYLCCECGICSYYACPMDLNPVKVIQYIKQQLQRQKIIMPKKSVAPVIDKLYPARVIPGERILSRLNLTGYYQKKTSGIHIIHNSDYVEISCSQHFGQPATPVVREEQMIHQYDIIAEMVKDQLGAAIHSPISGQIKKVTKNFIEIIK